MKKGKVILDITLKILYLIFLIFLINNIFSLDISKQRLYMSLDS